MIHSNSNSNSSFSPALSLKKRILKFFNSINHTYSGGGSILLYNYFVPFFLSCTFVITCTCTIAFTANCVSLITPVLLVTVSGILVDRDFTLNTPTLNLKSNLHSNLNPFISMLEDTDTNRTVTTRQRTRIKRLAASTTATELTHLQSQLKIEYDDDKHQSNNNQRYRRRTKLIKRQQQRRRIESDNEENEERDEDNNNNEQEEGENGENDKNNKNNCNNGDEQQQDNENADENADEEEAVADDDAVVGDDDALTDDDQNINYNYYYNSGYIQATTCRSYTIALDNEENEAESEDEETEDGNRQNYNYNKNSLISVIGQETFLFFNYVPEEQNYDGNDDAYYAYDDAYEDKNQQEGGGGEENNENNNNNEGDRRKRYRSLIQRNLSGDENDNEGEQQQQRDDDQNNNDNDDLYNNSDRGDLVLAKHWLSAFSNGSFRNGCRQIQDPIDLFEDYIPSMEDGSLSFTSNNGNSDTSYLYYGPICINGKVEIGIFYDNTCNAYIPGLSHILNKKVLSDWMTGVAEDYEDEDYQVNEEFKDNVNDDYGYYYEDDVDGEGDVYHSNNNNDLNNIYSYRTLIQQLNYYHNRDPTDCAAYPKICQEILVPAINLNTCQSLRRELLEEYDQNGDENGNQDNSNNYIDLDEIDESIVEEYGEFYYYNVDQCNNNENDDNINDEDNGNENDNVEGGEGDEGMNNDNNVLYYKLFQKVLDGYSNYNYYYYSYGDDDDDFNNNNNGDNNEEEHENNDVNFEGICYGTIESKYIIDALALGDWIDSNSIILKQELSEVYGVKSNQNAANKFWGNQYFHNIFYCIILSIIIFITGGLVLTIRIVVKKRKKKHKCSHHHTRDSLDDCRCKRSRSKSSSSKSKTKKQSSVRDAVFAAVSSSIKKDKKKNIICSKIRTIGTTLNIDTTSNNHNITDNNSNITDNNSNSNSDDSKREALLCDEQRYEQQQQHQMPRQDVLLKFPTHASNETNVSTSNPSSKTIEHTSSSSSGIRLKAIQTFEAIYYRPRKYTKTRTFLDDNNVHDNETGDNNDFFDEC